MSDFDPRIFDVLRYAVTLVKERGVRRLDTLRNMLLHEFPGEDELVEKAIVSWANHAKRNGLG